MFCFGFRNLGNKFFLKVRVKLNVDEIVDKIRINNLIRLGRLNRDVKYFVKYILYIYVFV